VLRNLDPRLSITPVTTLADITALGLLPQRLAAVATTAFGALALLLSALGVYGVIAFMVAQRTREIGIRMALGADRGRILRLIVASGLRLAVPGATVGAVAGPGFAFLLRGFILGVPPVDPVALVAAPAALLVAVLFACWVPAARACAVEPVQALKTE
jgi:ABC-type antimicrobial peptide transport system permease subunit